MKQENQMEKMVGVCGMVGRAIISSPVYALAGIVTYARDFDKQSMDVLEKLNSYVRGKNLSENNQ